jgi:hypothetical protein
LPNRVVSLSALSPIVASPSLSRFALDMKPAVLAGVGNGCWFAADVAECERDRAIGTEDCGDLSDDAVVLVVANPPLDREFIEE